MTKTEWIEEADFCERRAHSGEYGLFNYDRECFKRYCEIQERFARNENAPKEADRIRLARMTAA